MHRFDYSIPQFVTRVRGILIVVTPDIVSEVLHVPKVAHPHYLGCEHLRIVSKDELMSLFCETPSSWGERQNTPCSAFTKGPRFLNKLMTFILHPLPHYNIITKPRARILLSLIEDLSIDFPSHFILSLIDVYKNTSQVGFSSQTVTKLTAWHDFSSSSHVLHMWLFRGLLLARQSRNPLIQLLKLDSSPISHTHPLQINPHTYREND